MNPDSDYDNDNVSPITVLVAMLCALGGLFWLASSLIFLLLSEPMQATVIENPDPEDSSLLYRFADEEGVFQQGRCYGDQDIEAGQTIDIRYMKGMSHWTLEDSLPAILGGPALLTLIGFAVIAWARLRNRRTRISS